MAAPDMSADSSYFASLLTKPPPLTAFDAFRKTNSTYKEKTTRGGFFTVVIALVVALLVWTEAREYLYGEADYSFSVDRGISHELQLNFDATIATPCHYLTVDVRDAVGDRLHISDEFEKEGTSFDVGTARILENLRSRPELSASQMLKGSKGKKQFAKTKHVIEDGPACRIYGSMDVKKVTGNLHITTLGHGYMSWEHTDHALMNLSHVIHEFSFGPYFPKIVQPLDHSVELTEARKSQNLRAPCMSVKLTFVCRCSIDFHIFQYFLSVVSTTYVDARRRIMHTNQYSVTDMDRITEHGKGVPGIFFKYDIEPMSLTIRERTTTLIQFLVRLAGIIGGVLVCSDYGFRTADFLLQGLLAKDSEPLPGFPKSPRPKTPKL
ncbi:Erv41p [Sporobolomyces koalae]|uniref:Erv41p n=1 Tax=Sporobolomyces koalae TaxID=500713 RepID=UPI00316B5E9F